MNIVAVSDTLSEKVIKNVLSKIGSGDELKAAPDKEYLNALETLGFIKQGWDNELTEMGRNYLKTLQAREWD